jgi:hypothetical protein
MPTFAFGSAPVTVAAALAGLSPMMGLTHVVVGAGDTLSISVPAAESAMATSTPTSNGSKVRSRS